ncbi:MAG: MFS transporter, partial [Anaerolineae bacterium]|nr:MFS transporter [Anaerolineae bacterium]
MKATTRLTWITVLLFMSRGMIGPISSVFWRELGASYLVIGVLSTVTALTSILISPWIGQALDRLQQRRTFLIGGLLILAANTGGIALVPSYSWIFPLSILATVGQTAFGTSSLALMGDWFEYEARYSDPAVSRAGRRMGTYRGLASLGFGLMAFAAGTVVDLASLRMPFVLSGLFVGTAAVLALGMQEAPDDIAVDILHPMQDAKRDRKPGNTPAIQLPLVPLLVAALLWSLVTGAVYAVWANYMVEDVGFTPSQMTRLWSLASLTEFPLMIVAGWLSDRLGRLPMLSAGFVAWSLVFTGYLVVPAMPWIIAVQLIRGFAYSAHTATAMTYAAEVRQRPERGRVSGYY